MANPMDQWRYALARRLGRRFFVGWAMLGVAGLAMFVSGPGQSHTFSVFVGPIGDELGLSGTEMTLAYGTATLGAALCLPLMGRYLDRVGPRRMLAIVAVLLGAACLAFGSAGGIIWLTLGFAALRFLGQGSLMLGSANLVAQWFQRRRGFALSLMTLGFSASMAVHPALGEWLIDLVGWRQAWLWLGVATWVLLVPPLLMIVVNRPEDIGLRPDGAAPAAVLPDAEKGADAKAPDDEERSLTLRLALRTPAFYIISTGLFWLSMLVTALHFHQVEIFGAHGLSPQLAARSFTISAVVMVVAVPLIGRMLDRYRTEWMFAGALLVMVASLVAATQVRDLGTAVVYAIIFGVNNAATITVFSFVWPRYYGRKHLGSIQGTGQMIAVVGASVGPLPLGIAYDLYGTYNGMLLGLALLPAAWAAVVLFLRDPLRPAP